jgi:hypothetical protein
VNCSPTIINWLVSIPDVVWAAIGGSGLTLLGVFIQLRHDAKQRNKEREMSLRRDVYLPAAEQIAAAINYLAQISNSNFDEQGKMEPIHNFIAIVAKINVVGSDETVIASNILVGKFNSLFAHLMSKKLPIIKLKYEIKTLEKMAEYCQARQQIALADMKSLNFNKETDQGLWKLVQTQFEQAQKDSSKYQDELAKKRISLAKLSFDMLDECVKVGEQIQNFIIPVLIAIRKELKLPLNQKRYKEIIEQVRQDGKRTFDTFIADIKKDVDIQDK